MDRRVGVTLVGVLLGSMAAGCQMGAAAEPADTTAAQQLGIFQPDQLPAPCALLSTESIGKLFDTPVSATEGAPLESGGTAMLVRTCMWGDPSLPAGAIGLQIGVPDLDGKDVVENRTIVMKPFLQTSIGEDGRETMNLGELPTGGAKGATIYFRHNGYSVMIGHTGPRAATSTVETLALEVIDALDQS